MSNIVVKFDVGGHMFTIGQEIIEAGPPSKLKQLCTSGAVTQFHPISVDRPPEMFGAILALYQTKELHIPMTSCPGAFLNELHFWELDAEQLSECCYTRLQCFLDEQRTLARFREHQSKQNDQTESTFSLAVCPSGCLGRFRSAMWKVLDGNAKTILGRIYFLVSLFMVLLSIFTIAYGTDRTFQRHMTNCERLVYMKSSGMEDLNYVEDLLVAKCDEEELPTREHSLFRSDMGPDYIDEYEEFVDIYVPIKPTAEPENVTIAKTDVPGQTTTYLVGAEGPGNSGKYVKIPNMRVKIYTFVIMEAITVVFFTVDLVLRLLCCPSICRYFTSVINVADAAALVATYLHILLLALYQHHRYEDEWVDILQYMQMMRSLRLFRIVSNVRAGRVLTYTIGANAKDLLILILFLIAGMCAFASILYISEDRSTVKSIPNGWYWAIITMTTVGYGDIVPKTGVGKFLACACAVAGVLLFAMTVPIFANHFLTLYQYIGSENTFQKEIKRRGKNIVSIDEIRVEFPNEKAEKR